MPTLSTKRNYIVGLVSLGLGILFDYLFYDKQIGISFLIYVVLLLAVLFAFLYFFKVKYAKTIYWFLPVILFFALMVMARDNMFLLFWNIVLTIALLLLLTRNLIGFKIRNYLFLDYFKTAVLLPLNMLAKSFSAFGRMISVGKDLKEIPKISQVTKGILITLPIVLFFLFLLSAADLVFKKIVTNLFSFNFSFDPNVVAQIVWAIIFALIWLGVYTYILENASENEKEKENLPAPYFSNSYRFGNIEAGILFTTLNVLFLSFVIVQIKYLFAGHSAITKFGFTYAEYAHKGFGELIAVSLLTFALIYLAEKYIERSENKASRLFKILTGILMLLVLLIMASAFTRLSIYEQAYGFTLQRILVQAFIIWLAAVFLWLGYKIIKDVKDRPFIFGLFLSVIAFFVVFNLLNPDAFVVKKNINQFTNNRTLDTKYLSTLSADAIPSLILLLEMPNVLDKEGKQLSREVAITLKTYHDSTTKKNWQSYNVSHNQAMRLINSKWNLISSLAADNSSQGDLNAKSESLPEIPIKKIDSEAIGHVCNADGKICWDGSVVGRTGTDCTFTKCPIPKAKSAKIVTTLGQVTSAIGVSITPKEVVSDSRCPLGVQCIWAGTVEVHTVIATKVSNDEQVFKLGESKIIGDFQITLIEVAPNPKPGENIPKSTYRFTFEITNKL